MNLNARPSSYPFDQIDQDHHHSPHRHLVGCNHQVASSASLSCHIFMNQNQTQDNHIQYYHSQLYQSGQHDQDKGGSSSCEIKNKVLETSGLKLILWKKESDHDHGREVVSETNFPMKWTSSKMRMMKRMRANRDIKTSATTKFEDEKLEPSSSSLSSNNSSYNFNNSPIRVCSDCNTTKTPLWRSGPKGPKSLCNACGIRQRKVRRAMAVAANTTTIASCQPTAVKIKLQEKDQSLGTNEHASPLKKHCKMTATSSAAIVGSDGQKLGFEDFLINLSKKLALHSVFPEDEKDAAMLLMALSSGLIHG